MEKNPPQNQNEDSHNLFSNHLPVPINPDLLENCFHPQELFRLINKMNSEGMIQQDPLKIDRNLNLENLTSYVLERFFHAYKKFSYLVKRIDLFAFQYFSQIHLDIKFGVPYRIRLASHVFFMQAVVFWIPKKM